LKISENKAKIMLTREDVRRFDLDTEKLNYSDPETRNKIWKVLDQLKDSCNFDHKGYKLLIQFYPSRDGGAELFITKLENLPYKSERILSCAEDIAMLQSQCDVYNFKSLEDLTKAARILNAKKGVLGSELYYDDDSGYYLKLETRGLNKNGNICEFTVVLEFAERINRERYPYIREHCRSLAEKNAIELLATV
jgi:negative regulator of genetic competence, sporulation and motility